MRKLFTIVTVMLFTFSMTMPAYGAFTVIGSEPFTASVTPIEPVDPIIEPFSAELYNIADDSTATDISWATVTAGTDNWKAAQQYIAVKGYAVYADWGWGIQTYTNNTTYTGPGDPAGLIRADTTQSLPMCWRTKTSLLSAGSQELGINQGEAYGYTVLYDDDSTHAPGGSAEYFAWFFMMDKGTPDVDVTTAGNQAFGDYQDEATFIGSEGYHHAPGPVNYVPPTATDATYYVYLGAKFTLAVPGRVYSTSTLTVEMYHL